MAIRVYIGVYLAKLQTPWVKSLKEKRAIITPVTEKLKQRFPFSVARLAGLDYYDWEIIGVSGISGDAQYLESMLTKVSQFVNSHADCLVVENSIEIEPWTELNNS